MTAVVVGGVTYDAGGGGMGAWVVGVTWGLGVLVGCGVLFLVTLRPRRPRNVITLDELNRARRKRGKKPIIRYRDRLGGGGAA